MKTVEDITGLEKPILEDYMADQKNHPEDDMYDAYVDNLDSYAYNLERFIEREENKKEGDLNLLYNDLKELGRLNCKAIDLNCDIYIMLEEVLGVNFCKTNQNVYDALHEQWYDVLNRQERIIMGLQNLINMKKTGREEQKDENK